jgi:hypothetical protein
MTKQDLERLAQECIALAEYDEAITGGSKLSQLARQLAEEITHDLVD